MTKKMKGDYTQKEFNAILDVLVKMVKVYCSEKYHFGINTGYQCSFVITVHHWENGEIADMVMLDIVPWRKEASETLLDYIKKSLADHTDSDEFYKGLIHIVEPKEVA